VLALEPTNCDSLANLQEFPGLNQRYTNRLRWRTSALPAGCNSDVTNYRVYYRPTPTGAFMLLGTTTQTSYVHSDLAFSGGCYAVQAVAPSGVVSDTSNVACQDNCVFFKLPNIFTPNGDGQNAVFRPKNNSPVRSIHFKAFNRWGVKVFENTTTANDPVLINWNGGGPVGESGSTAKVSDGIYYYLAEVEFADFANTKRTYKGWVEIVR
jgi:gliding motility-associated-like protein